MNPRIFPFARPQFACRSLRTTAAMAALCATLTGCYVVPIQPAPGAQGIPAAAGVAVASQLHARLYPVNDVAQRYGVVNATVTNHLDGHGVLNAQIGGEVFSGDATRSATNRREGQANASGNRGTQMSCQYQMNSSQVGSGQCRMSNGAVFKMHVSAAAW